MHGRVMDILVVDDQPGVRQLIGVLGREEGHRMWFATNGQEAVEAARLIRPDLVFMDVRMPVMSGLEALPMVRESNPGTVVVIMSAYTGKQGSLGALGKDAEATLAKPFDTEQVRMLIRRVAVASCEPEWESAPA